MKRIVLREARPSHLPAIHALHEEQNRIQGTDYPIPRLFTAQGMATREVPISLVGVEEGSEEPVQAIWIERRAELMFAGCNPKATAFARRDIEGLVSLLTWLGYSGLHCDVPINVLEHITPPLTAALFERNDDRLAHFFRDLREKTT